MRAERVLLIRSGRHLRVAMDALAARYPACRIGVVGTPGSEPAIAQAGIAPEDVLPMQRKTGQFFLCIVDPINKDAVCIDRHAHDVAVGVPYGDWSRGLSTHSRYKLIADCYREAARRLGELPMVVQATTWVVWRDSLAGVGTRGSRV